MRYIIGVLALVDILVLYITFYFEFWTVIFSIVLFEVAVAGGVALGAWAVVYTS